jgi:hypothetical protein
MGTRCAATLPRRGQGTVTRTPIRGQPGTSGGLRRPLSRLRAEVCSAAIVPRHPPPGGFRFLGRGPPGGPLARPAGPGRPRARFPRPVGPEPDRSDLRIAWLGLRPEEDDGNDPGGENRDQGEGGEHTTTHPPGIFRSQGRRFIMRSRRAARSRMGFSCGCPAASALGSGPRGEGDIRADPRWSSAERSRKRHSPAACGRRCDSSRRAATGPACSTPSSSRTRIRTR